MVAVRKIDSNITGLSYAEETSLGTLPTNPTWQRMEPNSYGDFGGNPTLTARTPINPSRQRSKGVITDLEATGGFQLDVTQENLQDLMQGFLFADAREKGSAEPSAVTGTAYTVTAEEQGLIETNDLIFASGFGVAANNGLKLVTASNGTSISAADLASESSPPDGAAITVVGHQFASADLKVAKSAGAYARITTESSGKDLTELHLIPGEWIYVGGDTTAQQFDDSANNGFKRVRSVTEHAITVDKSDSDMMTDTGTGKTVQVFFGRVIKNETGIDANHPVKRRTYTLERTLGAPDDASTNVQAEYIRGATPQQITFNITSASKMTADLSFLSTENTLLFAGRTAGDAAYDAVKGGSIKADAKTSPAKSGSAYNTSSDVSRIRIALAEPDPLDEAPTAAFVYAQELTLSINNNANANKAVGFLGSFDITAGTLEVGGSVTAYFSSVQALQQIRDNESVTMDVILARDNAGMAFDMPLVSLGGGRVNATADQAIQLPLDMQAVSGLAVHEGLNHTILICYFDYLPDAAEE